MCAVNRSLVLQVRCEWLSREREIMSELSRESHPFIVRLYATYADETHVYLQLGAAMGGDMYWLLSRLESMRKTRYDLVEIIGRFYAASLSLALQHIHEHDVVYRDLKPENVIALEDLMIASLIYRDLKPENAIHGTEHGLGLRLGLPPSSGAQPAGDLLIASLIRCSARWGPPDCLPHQVLIDGRGFVLLCDFGLAKKVTDRTYTRCGTTAACKRSPRRPAPLPTGDGPDVYSLRHARLHGARDAAQPGCEHGVLTDCDELRLSATDCCPHQV